MYEESAQPGAASTNHQTPDAGRRTPGAVLQRLQERFTDTILETHSQFGDDTALIPREPLIEVLKWLRDEPDLDFTMLTDITAVDYLIHPIKKRERFEVVYHLYSLVKKHRVRIKIAVSSADPELESAGGLWKTADWLEREVWDMFGIRFRGHPNLKRILNHMEFVGHPLRKDYPLKKRQPIAGNDPLWDEMEKRLKLRGLK